MTRQKGVYVFGQGVSDGNASMKALVCFSELTPVPLVPILAQGRDPKINRYCATMILTALTSYPGAAGIVLLDKVLGGKGANLAEMCRIGLNVPPGFTISTETCSAFHEGDGQNLPEHIWKEVLAAIEQVEKLNGKKFADPDDPLLLSVRSGAAISMPGMMDTVLNLGLNDTVVKGFAAKAGDRFAYDCYRRFLDMYGNVVLGFQHSDFEKHLTAIKETQGVKHDSELSTEALKELVEKYKSVYKAHGCTCPTDPLEQLRSSICAVFMSWEGDRAVAYRKMNKITGLAGTAVNIQTMVYGNLGETSGTGVLFTRNPSTGENKLYGEYLINAQGEDVVAGIRTPQPIAVMASELPKAFAILQENCNILEREYQDIMDIEFTVQEGVLYMLQCRTGKRNGKAAMKFVCDFVDSGMTTVPSALSRMVEPRHLDQLLHPFFVQQKGSNGYGKGLKVLGKGLAASPGAAVGEIVFDSTAAEKLAESGKAVILVRQETSAEDVKGMYSSEGVLTQQGGMTSHAAVVARGWGKPCIAGCTDLVFNEVTNGAKKSISLNGDVLYEGDVLSLNGNTGEVIAGAAEVAIPKLEGDVLRVLKWADELRKMRVLANADTPEDSDTARINGADGIGLARTEHMFFKTAERIHAVRSMIMHEAESDSSSLTESLHAVEEFQRADFEGIFKAMDGLPVTIRLLDPPLHEFLPTVDNTEAIEKLAGSVDMKPEAVIQKIRAMHEVNPMLGFRGCRLGIAVPELARVQVRAIISAALNMKQQGVSVKPHIMVPLVSTIEEYQNQESLIRTTAIETIKTFGDGATLEFYVGSMIETPRAVLMSGELAKTADFFSFGTNDLTQMTYGLSRDDFAKFMPVYINQKIIPADPFQVLDAEGVGQLVKMSTEQGRRTSPDLEVGICGEQGGEPSSVAFCNDLGLNYVSCSPLRVPIARLAAAQAAIKSRGPA